MSTVQQIVYKVKGEKEVLDMEKALAKLNDENDTTQKEVDKTNESFKKQSKTAEQTSDTLSTVADQLTLVTDQFGIAGVSATQFGQKIGGATKGLNVFGKQFKLLNNIFKASVIGIVVAAFIGLATWLTKTAKGGELVTKIMDKLNGIFKGLIKIVADLGKAWEKGFLNVINDSIKSVERFREAQRALLVTTRAFTEEIDKLVQKEELLNQRADDATLSLLEQRKAAQEAAKAADERIVKELQLSHVRLNTLRAEMASKQELGEQEENEFLDRIAEQQSAIKQLETERLVLRAQNSQRIRQITQDEFELELDALIDLTDNQKAINERRIANERLTFKQRIAILEETKKFNDQAFADQVALFEARIEKEIEVDKILEETNSARQKRMIDELGLSEILTTRFLNWSVSDV